MKIIVCVKHVIDGSNVTFNPDSNCLNREVDSGMNGFDKNALEAALQLAEKTDGNVTVLSMGPEKAKVTLKECLAMGASEAVLISGPEFASSDVLTTGRVLAAAIRKMGGYDLILCGKQSTEGEVSMVGAGIAEQLMLPLVSCVSAAEATNGVGRLEREHQDGFEMVETDLPAVLTITKSKAFTPRFPSVRATMKAGRASIPVWGVSDLGLSGEQCGKAGARVQIVEVKPVSPRTQGVVIAKETVEESAAALVEHMIAAKLIEGGVSNG